MTTHTYPHWYELSEADRAAARHNDACALATVTYEQDMPLSRVLPETRKIGAHSTEARRARGIQPRQYASRYVGVTFVKGRWVAQWGERGKHQGPRRKDELEAAWDRARALGRDWLEVRV